MRTTDGGRLTDDPYKQKSRAAYDRYAPQYDTGVSGRHARWLHAPVLAALEELKFASVLDVACGTGVLLEKDPGRAAGDGRARHRPFARHARGRARAAR